jgi:hypothetical protein
MLDQTSGKSNKLGQQGHTASHMVSYAKFQKEHFSDVRSFAPFCARVRFCALVVRPILRRPNPQKNN